jgi:cytoskeleton protein RodZ
MMEHLPEDNAVQNNPPVAIQTPSLGSMLREAREKLGLSVADVAVQIKFAPRQIEALEADDFEHLPEPAFVRGFVRSYAKILGLDAQILLASMPQTKTAAAELIPASVGVPFPNAYSVRQQNMIWLGAASLVAVILIGFSFWQFKAPPDKQSKTPQVESVPVEAKVPDEPAASESAMIEPSIPDASKGHSSAAMQASAQATKNVAPVQEEKTPISRPIPVHSTDSETSTDAASQPTELRLVFGEESWTEIKDKDDNVLSSRLNPAGSELRLEGNAPFSMLIGHAAMVTLYYKGKQVDLTPYINKYSEVAHLQLK